LLTFKRSVVVDTQADLGIALHASTVNGMALGIRVAVMTLVALVLVGFALLAQGLKKTQAG
jgi:hypothetical protein